MSDPRPELDEYERELLETTEAFWPAQCEAIAAYDAYAAWEAENEPDIADALFAMAAECMGVDE